MVEVATALGRIPEVAEKLFPGQRVYVHIPQEVQINDNLRFGPGYLLTDMKGVTGSFSSGFDRYHFIETEKPYVAHYCSFLWADNLKQLAKILEEGPSADGDHLDSMFASWLVEANYLKNRSGLGFWANLPLNTDSISLCHHRSFRVMARDNGNSVGGNAKQIIELRGRPHTNEAVLEGDFFASCQPATLLPLLEKAVRMIADFAPERYSAIRQAVIKAYGDDPFKAIDYADSVVF